MYTKNGVTQVLICVIVLNTICNKLYFKEKVAGPNLDKNSVWLSDPPHFYENHIELYFDAKHLKTSLNRR